MYHDISHLPSRLINGPTPLRQIYFASTSSSTPELAYQVDFPRPETMPGGEFTDNGVTGASVTLRPCDALPAPAGGWNFPQWLTPVTTLSILSGRQQLGSNIVQWDGKQYQNPTRQHVTRRGSCIGSSLLQTLNEIQMQSQEQQTARPTVVSPLSHCRDLLGSQIQTVSRSQAPFEAIRNYIGKRYAPPLTRESVVQTPYISPNYPPHLFQKTGAIGFNEYLNHTRLEHARMLSKGYELKIEEMAHICGFVDSNYFCRPLYKNTERPPSEYRRQYHSQLMKKEANPE